MMPKHSSRAPWGRHVTALFAVSLLTLGACSDDDNGGVGPSTITGVQIVTLPNNQTLTNLTPGDRRKILGVPVNEKGNFIDRPVTYSSSNTAVFTVSNDTIIAQLGGGTAYLRATAGGKTDSVAIGVRYRVNTITSTPAAVTLRREGAQQLTLQLRDQVNAVVTGRPVTYASSDPTVATVSATGLVTATATAADASTATITITAPNTNDGGVAATQTVLVTVSGDAVVGTVTVTSAAGADNVIGFRGNVGTVQLTATARSGLGNTLSPTITWSSSNASIATVDASGLVTFAGGTGNVTIRARAAAAGANNADVDGTAAFEVATALINGATVTAPNISAGQGANFAFSATRVGAANFSVATAGGSGDADLYVIAPGVANWTTTDGGGSNWVCRPFLIGNSESCSITAPVAGWYRIRIYAYTADGAANGVNISVTHP